MTKLRKMLLRNCGESGLVRGRRLMGGVPKVTQWMRLKVVASGVSSLAASGVVLSMSEKWG